MSETPPPLTDEQRESLTGFPPPTVNTVYAAAIRLDHLEAENKAERLSARTNHRRWVDTARRLEDAEAEVNRREQPDERLSGITSDGITLIEKQMDEAGVPREEYAGQAGGVVEFYFWGRIDWLLRHLTPEMSEQLRGMVFRPDLTNQEATDD